MIRISRSYDVSTGEGQRRVAVQLLLEQKILRDHRSHAARATQLRHDDGEIEQSEQEVLHAIVSVGQGPRAMQRC